MKSPRWQYWKAESKDSDKPLNIIPEEGSLPTLPPFPPSPYLSKEILTIKCLQVGRYIKDIKRLISEEGK